MTPADLPDLYTITGDPEADRAAWLEARRKGIGASDVGNIVCPLLDEHSFGSPWDVLAAKRDGATLEDNDSMRLGRNLEAGIGAAWAEKTGYHVEPAKMVRHPHSRWMLATPDFWVYDSKGCELLGTLECKNTRTTDWPDDGAEATCDNVPLKYMLQCEWQRWVCESAIGRPLRAWLAPLIMGGDLRSFEVSHNPALLDFAAQKCHAFWFDNVVNGEPLPADTSAECWAHLSSRRGERMAELGQEQRALAIRYTAAKEREAAARAEADDIKVQLAEAMAGIKSASDEHYSVTWSGGTKPRKHFDKAAFGKAHPELLAEFTSEKPPAAASLRITRRGD